MRRELAEYPNSYSPLGPGEERIETSRYTLCLGADLGASTVQRQRFSAAEVDDVLAEVRSLLCSRGRRKTQWEIGSHAEPESLPELLLQKGLVRDKEPYAVALVLDSEPPPAPPGITARRVETIDEFVAANSVQAHAFGMEPGEELDDPAVLAQRFRQTPYLMHAAWLERTMVSAGVCARTPHGLLLYGGGTLPSARGRGAYRALIRARWEESVALGTPTLFTQAGAMSRPILERIGFKAVGHVHMLIDEFDTEPASDPT